MGTLLAPTPDDKKKFVGDAYGGVKGASSVRRPSSLPEGHVFLHGVETDPLARNETNGALSELSQLMTSEVYQSSEHPLHAGAQARVKQLFEFLHPPPIED